MCSSDLQHFGQRIPHEGLFINAGSTAQYIDRVDNIWVEDKPYSPGSFGYFGGKPSFISLKGKITGTERQQLYYSYLEDLKSYHFDVPDGEYIIALYIAEPEFHEKGKRVFDVMVNQEKWLDQFDAFAEKGYCGAIVKEKRFIISGGKGLIIGFTPVQGKPILNGIRIRIVN